jgi:hypothetical protein
MARLPSNMAASRNADVTKELPPLPPPTAAHGLAAAPGLAATYRLVPADVRKNKPKLEVSPLPPPLSGGGFFRDFSIAAGSHVRRKSGHPTFV